jgi:hypothetical protein
MYLQIYVLLLELVFPISNLKVAAYIYIYIYFSAGYKKIFLNKICSSNPKKILLVAVFSYCTYSGWMGLWLGPPSADFTLVIRSKESKVVSVTPRTASVVSEWDWQKREGLSPSVTDVARDANKYSLHHLKRILYSPTWHGTTLLLDWPGKPVVQHLSHRSRWGKTWCS